jgi:DNA ligase-associated metallophosphoesterase
MVLVAIELHNEEIHLLWQKALLWKRHNAMVIADLHLGKINHFRKSGIPVPLKANTKNLEQLATLIITVKPHRVIFLGDLFHSYYNSEWEVVKQLVNNFSAVSFELVPGNHDVLSDDLYRRSGIHLHNKELEEGPFVFTHHPMDNVPENRYNVAGHLHPGIQLSGGGRQSVLLPCFYFSKRQAYLPAFGAFTGMARIHPNKADRIFAVADEEIICC